MFLGGNLLWPMLVGVKGRRALRLFKDPRGRLLNGLAIAYVVSGYGAGWLLIVQKSWILAAAGVPILAHAMLIAAYLLHEACHDTIFARRGANRWLGEWLSFICGGSYASFERIRHLHLRHHRERVDVTCFDHREFLLRAPGWFRGSVLALEWAYLPAVEALMHLQVVVRPWLVHDQRRYLPRVVVILALRLGLLAIVATYAPRAVVLYLVAYLLLLSVLNLFDAFHHTYQLWVVGEDGTIPDARPGREYERIHTFSNLISVRYRWLNLLSLNFGFHNAHHERAGLPWYRLPALHRELFAETQQVLSIRELLRSFHRNRVRRVLEQDYGTVSDGPARADAFVGAHGVSFLTVV